MGGREGGTREEGHLWGKLERSASIHGRHKKLRITYQVLFGIYCDSYSEEARLLEFRLTRGRFANIITVNTAFSHPCPVVARTELDPSHQRFLDTDTESECEERVRY